MSSSANTFDISERAKDFWQWWEAERPRFQREIESGDPTYLVPMLNEKVKALHPDLAWELAPGRQSDHALIITAENNPEVRSTAYRLHKLAPRADEVFEYHPARQQNLDAAPFSMEIAGAVLDLDQSKVVVNLEEEREFIHVGFFHPEFKNLEDGIARQVSILSIDWLLGEEGVERWVGSLEVLTEEASDAIPATALPEIVNAMAARNAEVTWALMAGEQADGTPIFAMARRPLKAVDFPLFDLHVAVTVEYPDTRGNGLPDNETLDALRKLEDDLVEYLDETCVMAAYETGGGSRVFHFYTDSAEADAARLTEWCEQNTTAKVTTTFDPAWRAVEPFG